jgi:hypothetical protein
MKTYRILLCVFALFTVAPAQDATTLRSVTNTNAREIVARIAENNRKRQQGLQSYTGQREYHLLYTGFGGRHEADLVVSVKYQSPDNKDFTAVSESGSHVIVNRVFNKILETEKEAADQKSQASTALSEENYEFELLGQEDLDGRPAYVFHVEPKTANRLLYRGRVWVDAQDFALCKIEGEPAKRPSMWISKVEVHHRYQKIGDFWLPAQNVSNTDVRIGGHATLSIQYRDYKVNSDPKLQAASASAEQIPPAANAGALGIVDAK